MQIDFGTAKVSISNTDDIRIRGKQSIQINLGIRWECWNVPTSYTMFFHIL